MKHKIGDKVKIKSLEWYEHNKNANGYVNTICGFVKSMREYCGKEAVITDIRGNGYRVDIDNGEWAWNDEMFEEGEALPSNKQEYDLLDACEFKRRNLYYATFTLDEKLNELKSLSNHSGCFDKQQAIETLEEIIEYGKQTLEKLKK